MRFFAIIVAAFACLSSLARGAAAAPPAGEVKQLFKPDAFETLVNPNCSHCVDEAKRRSGELRSDDRVLAWIRGKYQGGAIPWRFFLAPYRVISDTYGVFVYDPDAGFVRGYEPSLDFRFHGWRNGVMVIRHRDGTLFSALSGRAFAGPRQGESLKPIATLETDWGYFTKAYPGAVAYHMFEKYRPHDLPKADNADSLSTRLEANPRGVNGHTRVIGLAVGDHAKAWPLAAIEAAGGVITDELDGQKLLVLWYPQTQTAAIYAPQTDADDATAERPTLSIVRDGADERAPFIDRQTGSRWGIEGRAVAGPLMGQTLRWLPGVQCRWFAWAAEYPQSELHDGPRDTAPPKTAAQLPRSNSFRAVIVDIEQVNAERAARWRGDGHRAAAVVLDEQHTAADYQRAARLLADAGLELYYWVEVARQPDLARQHPQWMASLGMHDDWHARFPDAPSPQAGQVAKAFPWVPIGYRQAYDEHLRRIERLLKLAAGDYRGLLLNDLQGGPASCGCGNLQCRWATDYGVPSTGDKLPGDDVAARFVADVRKLTGQKLVVPVWMTECQDRDLPAARRTSGASSGYCGGVACSQNTCPKVFAKQWNSLVAGYDGPVGVFAAHQELGRTGVEYGDEAEWIGEAVGYLDEVPPRHGGTKLPHERLWLVVQGYALPDETVSAARRVAEDTGAGAVFVALSRLDQSYEPQLITAKEALKD
ncbi:MAG TPA: DUF3179 domain-containing (seleno)protein [Pirellulales bacterium]